MLAAFILSVIGIAFAGLALFAAMCAAIRSDDKEGLPSQPPTLRAALTRRVLGMTSSRPAPRSGADRERCLAGSARSADPRPDAEGR